MAHDAFICYCPADKVIAEALCPWLEAVGLRCWMAPRDLPREKRNESIADAICSSRVMVLVFSAAANDSALVRQWVEMAASTGIPIAPLRIDDVKPSAALKPLVPDTPWMRGIEEEREQLEAVAGALLAKVGKRRSSPRTPMEALDREGKQLDLEIALMGRELQNQPSEPEPDIELVSSEELPSDGESLGMALFEEAEPGSDVLEDRVQEVNVAVTPPPPSESEDYVFISYKREDLPRIAPFMHRIVNSGYSIWYDRGIAGGKEWNAVIDDKVIGCKALVVFLTQAAVESKMVRREIILADSENRPILGVRLDRNVQLKHGLKGIMTQYQTIDAGADDPGKELANAIRNIRIL